MGGCDGCLTARAAGESWVAEPTNAAASRGSGPIPRPLAHARDHQGCRARGRSAPGERFRQRSGRRRREFCDRRGGVPLCTAGPGDRFPQVRNRGGAHHTKARGTHRQGDSPNRLVAVGRFAARDTRRLLPEPGAVRGVQGGPGSRRARSPARIGYPSDGDHHRERSARACLRSRRLKTRDMTGSRCRPGSRTDDRFLRRAFGTYRIVSPSAAVSPNTWRMRRHRRVASS